MNKTDAAKLAQAYQWLSDGKEVEWRYHNCEWEDWDGLITFPPEFRIKPEPEPLVEGWANIYSGGPGDLMPSPQESYRVAGRTALRTAVHMREVREPDIEAMVKRFLDWKVPIGDPNGPAFISLGGVATGAYLLTYKQAEQMIRHILGEEK